MATKRAYSSNYNKDLLFYFWQQGFGMHICIISQHIIILSAIVFILFYLNINSFLNSTNLIE